MMQIRLGSNLLIIVATLLVITSVDSIDRASRNQFGKGFVRRKLIKRPIVLSKRPGISNPSSVHESHAHRYGDQIKNEVSHGIPDDPTYPIVRRIRVKRPKGKPGQHVGFPRIGNEEPKNRTLDEKRFLSLFTIVRFRNDPCSTTTGTNGTCYSQSDCSNRGGTASGSCASGFGVCCLFTATCGSTITANCTYFQSSGYPSTFDTVGACQATVNKANSNICQLRLDFENFVLAQPEATDHVCQNDQFIITGGSPIPAICGTNSGQHIYVDAGLNSNSPCVLSAVTSGTSFARSFSVKVTQVQCSSIVRAPDGCLQYFTGVSGQVQSFNYDNAGGLQLSNTDYSICFRMERNFCGIQYSACSDTINTIAMSFSVTGGTPNLGSVVGTNCNTDWITIPCATNTNNPTAQTGIPTVCVDRICGMVFNSVTTAAGQPNVPVNSFMKPFNIFVHTDSMEGSSGPAETNNRGFCLNFVQQPCTASTG